MEKTKACSYCLVAKPLTEYYQNNLSKKIGALMARCKECWRKAEMVRYYKKQGKRKAMAAFTKQDESLKALCAVCNRDLGNSKHLKCAQCQKTLSCIKCKIKFEDLTRKFSMCKRCRPKARVCLD